MSANVGRSKVLPLPDSPPPEQSMASLFLDPRQVSRGPSSARGLPLWTWGLLCCVCPLIALTILAAVASYTTDNDRSSALMMSQEVAMWVSSLVNSTLTVPQQAASLASQVNLSIEVCNRSQLSVLEAHVFFELAQAGSFVVRSVTGANATTEVWYGNGVFHMSLTAPSATATGCTFPAPSAALLPLPVPSPTVDPVPCPFPAPFPLSTALAGPLNCSLYTEGAACDFISPAGESAMFAIPMSSLTSRLAPNLLPTTFSNTVSAVIDRSHAMVVASPCGGGQAVAALSQCSLAFPESFAAGDSVSDLYAVVIVDISSSLTSSPLTVVVSTPLADFHGSNLSIPILVPALAIFVVFTTATCLFLRHVAYVLRSLSQSLHVLHFMVHAERENLELSTSIREGNELVEAFNAALKVVAGMRTYVPEPTPRSGPQGRARSESRSSEGSLCTGHVRAQRQGRNANFNSVIDVRPSHSLLELDKGEQNHSLDVLTKDAAPDQPETTCTALSHRMGTVLVVELWYQNAPLSAMAADLSAQQAIGETFLQMVVACLEENRGTIVSIDIGRVVASWNVFSSQATHEYWACRAALEMRTRFPASLNTLCNFFSKGQHTKSNFLLLVAVARGNLKSGCVRTSGHSVTVLHGDCLRMADRLLSLNRVCHTCILMPQQTFEAVQGYITAEIVDYVLDPSQDQVVAVYQLLGTDAVDTVGFGGLYKEALVCFNRHDFEEAGKRLEECQTLLQDPDAKFVHQRRVQCGRLQKLIDCFRAMNSEDFETTVPDPYFRQFYADWETFDQLHDSALSTTHPRDTFPQNSHSTYDMFTVRGGLPTVTADVLTGILSKEAGDSEENLSPVRERLKSRNRAGRVWSDDNGGEVAQNNSVSLADLESRVVSSPVGGADPDPNRSGSTMEREPSTLVVVVGSIAGRCFRDIFGRMWRCSKECVGRGGFGTVYLGIDEQGKMSAIKEHTFNCNSETIRQKVTVNEIVMLWNLQHKNIVTYQGCAVVGSSLAIIMEYISCGSLEFIVETFGCISEGVAVQYTRDVIRGLAFLHSNRVVHLDIKPANVLLDQHGTCKLADFGTATALSNLMDLEAGLMGTPVYMAPERISGSTSDLSDIWSWGITLAEVLSGKRAYPDDLPPEAILFGLYAGTLIPDIPEVLSLHATAFLKVCLARDPADRANAQDLLGHPFLL